MAFCRIFMGVLLLAGYLLATVTYYSSFAAADPIDSSVFEQAFNGAEGTHQDAGAISSTPPISIKYTTAYPLSWRDAGSGADDDVAFFYPHWEDGFFALGDVAVRSHSRPRFAAALVKGNIPGAVAPPAGFEAVWQDKGSGAYWDVTIYRMIPQHGFVCLGYVTVRSYYYLPGKEQYRCINAAFVANAGSYRYIWDDSGSGADQDGSVWDNFNGNDGAYIQAHTFTAIASHSAPSGKPWLLKASATEQAPCTGGPERYKPIFWFDGASNNYCYPDWPRQANDGQCHGTLSNNVPMFWQLTTCGEFQVYTYWVWYGWQKACIFDEGSHGDDWEHVSVYLTRACNVHSVVFHQHSGHYTRRFGSYDSQGERPVVFVGKVAHGSYHAHCTGVCSIEEFFTKGCLGSVNYCQGGCGYWNDFRNPGPSWEGTLQPLQPGVTVDGLTRPARSICGIGSCEGSGDRILTTAGCWQNAP